MKSRKEKKTNIRETAGENDGKTHKKLNKWIENRNKTNIMHNGGYAKNYSI